MKLFSSTTESAAHRDHRAFTLIEMLVVIAIIGILAAMIIPLAGVVAKSKIIARAKAQIASLSLSIDTYKLKKGVYPPDNTNGPAGAFTNQLYYELWGCLAVPSQNLYTNLYNSGETISVTTLGSYFGAAGIINSSADTNEVLNLFPRLNPADLKNIGVAGKPVWVFVNPSPGPTANLPSSSGQPVNVIRYVSTNPTNNPNTYDLWVDVLIGGKTNRISNWSKEPEIVFQ